MLIVDDRQHEYPGDLGIANNGWFVYPFLADDSPVFQGMETQPRIHIKDGKIEILLYGNEKYGIAQALQVQTALAKAIEILVSEVWR